MINVYLESKHRESQNNSSGDPNSYQDSVNIVAHADLETQNDIEDQEDDHQTYNSQGDCFSYSEGSQQHEVHWNFGPQSLNTHHRNHHYQSYSTADVQ